MAEEGLVVAAVAVAAGPVGAVVLVAVVHRGVGNEIRVMGKEIFEVRRYSSY